LARKLAHGASRSLATSKHEHARENRRKKSAQRPRVCSVPGRKKGSMNSEKLKTFAIPSQRYMSLSAAFSVCVFCASAHVVMLLRSQHKVNRLLRRAAALRFDYINSRLFLSAAFFALQRTLEHTHVESGRVVAVRRAQISLSAAEIASKGTGRGHNECKRRKGRSASDVIFTLVASPHKFSAPREKFFWCFDVYDVSMDALFGFLASLHDASFALLAGALFCLLMLHARLSESKNS
jgi:hypothetical protein